MTQTSLPPNYAQQFFLQELQNEITSYFLEGLWVPRNGMFQVSRGLNTDAGFSNIRVFVDVYM